MEADRGSAHRSDSRHESYSGPGHRGRYWVVLAGLAAAAALLYSLSVFVKLDMRLQSLSQAVADALVVAIIVSLAVEPRLLRYFAEELKVFGQQLGTQTFWSSFYSRAPRVYIDAIKALAAAEQFSQASNWIVSFDWADSKKTIVKLSLEHTNYRENRSSKEFPVFTRTFVYESPFSGHNSQIHQHAILCETIEFYSDLLKDGRAKAAHEEGGILRIRPSDTEVPYLMAPPGARFTVMTRAETYAPATGHFPLIVNVPVLRLTVQVKGNALQDLYISIDHASLGPPAQGKGDELAERGPITVGEVFVIGQAALLSWAPSHGSNILDA